MLLVLACTASLLGVVTANIEADLREAASFLLSTPPALAHPPQGRRDRSVPRNQHQLLTIATNEKRFAKGLSLAAQVILGGQNCAAAGYCSSGDGILSPDGRTCCSAGDCGTADESRCTMAEEVDCTVPSEHDGVTTWDVVFFDYTAGRAPLADPVVSFAALWHAFGEGSNVPNVDQVVMKVLHIRDAGLRKLEFLRRYVNPIDLTGDAVHIGAYRSDDQPKMPSPAPPFAGHVASYEYMLMWDGDGELADNDVPVRRTATWDSCNFLRLMRDSNAGLGQPALSWGGKRKKSGSDLTSWMLDNGRWQTPEGKLAGLYRYRPVRSFLYSIILVRVQLYE